MKHYILLIIITEICNNFKCFHFPMDFFNKLSAVYFFVLTDVSFISFNTFLFLIFFPPNLSPFYTVSLPHTLPLAFFSHFLCLLFSNFLNLFPQLSFFFILDSILPIILLFSLFFPAKKKKYIYVYVSK